MRPLQEPYQVKSRFNKIWKVCIYFCIIFKLKCVFPLLFSQCTHQKTCMRLHTMKKHPKSNQNIANHCTTCQLKAIFHVLKLYSANQIPFCLRLPFITCNFLVNNLHFMMYSKCIIQHHWKISYQTLYYW